MDLELHGKRSLVTASSAGIGADIARRLAAEGCAVLVHGRDASRAAAVVGELRAFGVESDSVLGDLTEDAGAAVVAERARDWGVSIVVHNAGPFSEHDWETSEPQMWLDAMNGNVVSIVRLTRALLPTMRAAGWGRIVTISTRGATIPLTNMVEYSAAKAAVLNLTVSLAQHLAGSGITVTCVTPGVIATDGLRRMFAERAVESGWPQDWAELEPRIVGDYAPNPSGRLGTGADIAATVAFLVSPLADYINGTEIRVDGGITPVA